jgi:hypothetical protein
MTVLAAIAVLLIAAATWLALKGRAFLRRHGYPPVRVHGPADVLRLMSIGYSALNKASEDAALRRMRDPRA